MSIRVRRPETTRLELTHGDHLVVKTHLTAGEYREFLRASTKPMAVTAAGAPQLELDPMLAGVSLVLAYLLDWSFCDADGRPLVIADQPRDVVTAALNAIESDAYMEVQRAVQAHQTAQEAAVAEQKKMTPGATSSVETLTSVA
jgi:hypothetical protein